MNGATPPLPNTPTWRDAQLKQRDRVVSFTARPLPPRAQSSWYPLDRRLGGPQSRSGRGGKRKIPTPTGTRTPIVQPVAYTKLKFNFIKILKKKSFLLNINLIRIYNFC
jgi:hypothetical protein